MPFLRFRFHPSFFAFSSVKSTVTHTVEGDSVMPPAFGGNSDRIRPPYGPHLAYRHDKLSFCPDFQPGTIVFPYRQGPMVTGYSFFVPPVTKAPSVASQINPDLSSSVVVVFLSRLTFRFFPPPAPPLFFRWACHHQPQ